MIRDAYQTPEGHSMGEEADEEEILQTDLSLRRSRRQLVLKGHSENISKSAENFYFFFSNRKRNDKNG